MTESVTLMKNKHLINLNANDNGIFFHLTSPAVFFENLTTLNGLFRDECRAKMKFTLSNMLVMFFFFCIYLISVFW